MAIVPNYKRSARLTPRYQRNIEVSASAEHMGAAIGRGVKGLGQGIGTAGKALHAAARLDNAKEREQQEQQKQVAERERQTRIKNQLSQSMEKNRADVQKIAQGPEAYADDPDLKDFGSSVDDVRRVEGFLKTAPKDEADSIRPGMEVIQVNASNRANQLRQEQVLIASQQADERYLNNFIQEAVADRNDPDAVKKHRIKGLANIQTSAERDGLDDTEAAALAHTYSSKLDKDVVLAKLEDDPALALDDYDQLRPRLVETDRQELDRTFSFVRKDEEVKSQISGILSLRRHEASLSAARQTSNPSTTPPILSELQQASIPETESDQPSGNPVPFSYLNAASPVADRALDQDLTPTFATNLDAMMEDAPQDIRDGLEILADQDRMPIKPDGESDYWSEQQGQRKVRIRYHERSLSKAPLPVRDWLADNAESYGLFMPVGSTAADSKSPEDRIADGFDTFLVSSLDSPTSRSLGPSAKQMEEAIAAIDNPDTQEAARANLQIELDRQSKQDKAGQLNATRELWAAIDDGKSLDDVPISIRVAAGSATIAEATDFIRAREGGKIIQTDAVTLSELNRMMANNPDRFAGQDLDAYRNQISRNDLKELKQYQTDLLKQDSQALKRTEIYKATFEQADQLLQQLGRSTTGPDGEIDPEVSRLNAQFFVNLKARIDYEWDRNEGQALNGVQIHDLIQKQLAADLQALQEVNRPNGTPRTSNWDERHQLINNALQPIAESPSATKNPDRREDRSLVQDLPVEVPASLKRINSLDQEDLDHVLELATRQQFSEDEADDLEEMTGYPADQILENPERFRRNIANTLAQEKTKYSADTAELHKQDGQHVQSNEGTKFRRGDILPFMKNSETGEVSWAWPQFALSLWEAFKLPGDVYSGKVDPRSDEAYRRAFDLAGMFTGGSLIPRRPSGSFGMGGRRLADKAAPSQGKLTGHVTRIPDEAGPVNVRSLELENKTAKDLAKAGIDVEQNPKVPGLKNPDYMIEGVVWDCYAPNSWKFDGIRDGIADKIAKEQAFHIVVNMTDSSHGIKKLVKRLQKHPVPGLKGLMIVDKYGRVKRIF